MHTITISGTTYTLKPGSAAAESVTRPIKPHKLPRKGDKRQYPTYVAGVTSTADYVRSYFYMNSQRTMPAYGTGDHLALYAPLPDAPAATYQGLDSVETIE
jgi:hypothetical protein